MKIPSIEEAERLIEEASRLNPGPWIEHNRTAGLCARTIAEKCDGLKPDVAYVMGLLHDIGRREGIMDMKHIYAGYLFMSSLGYDDSARICLTHSFPYKNIGAYNGQNDCSEEETEYIQNYLDMLEYNVTASFLVKIFFQLQKSLPFWNSQIIKSSSYNNINQSLFNICWSIRK